jgi:hypothetical protein
MMGIGDKNPFLPYLKVFITDFGTHAGFHCLFYLRYELLF